MLVFVCFSAPKGVGVAVTRFVTDETKPEKTEFQCPEGRWGGCNRAQMPKSIDQNIKAVKDLTFLGAF